MLKSLSQKQKIVIIIAIVLVVSLIPAAFLFVQPKEPIDCPFTNLGWDTTEQELFDTEGSYASSYASTYGGLTYTYGKIYLGRQGTVKYMFDEEGILMSVAWAYSSADTEELSLLYDEIESGITELYGESEYQTENHTNYGDVWRQKEGNIILSVMLVESNLALQVAYVNPANQ